ncbi:head GIN domain-containing protein [Bacteroides ihuae]|uniref:head GIN domain-containing protein n=1 Tax=Bacteroides ihuae TaxID=1852362 RepID=UPI0008DA2430|nr:head GIN domain-containing protein [Bacteroides ihuae]
MKHKLYSSGVLAFLLFLSSCTQAQIIVGSGNIVTKGVKVGLFNSLKLQGSPDVIYKQTTGKPSVELYGSDNIVGLLEVKIESGILLIKFKDNVNIRNRGKLEVRVSGPALERLTVQGSGDVLLVNGIKSHKDLAISIQGSGDIQGKGIESPLLSLSVKGSGDIDLSDVNARRTNVKIAGSGDITLRGKCQEVDLGISGSGDINAAGLMAQKVLVKVAGSGDVSCYATDYLTGSVSGSGDVGYKGNPKINFSKKGLYKL